jgi:serine protease Do
MSGREYRHAAVIGSGAVQVASLDLEDSVQMLLELAPTPSPFPSGKAAGAPAGATRPSLLFPWIWIAVAILIFGTALARGGEPTLAEEAAFRAAVARVADAVVRIEPVVASEAAVGKGAEAVAGSGPSTGFVIDAAGWVLTTAFAVPKDVTDVVVVRPDGGRQAARAVGRDVPRGLVLLTTDALPDAPPLEIVPRADLAPGQWTIAVGRGWTSAEPAVAVGVLSAVNRAWGRAVQTDASVSPANYGGPLIDIRGRVIGILAPLPADTAGMNLGTELYDAGIGFAVPLADVAPLRSRLEQGETLAGGVLGISYRSDDLINGEPVIASCRQGSPAARAGLRPGDRIVAIDRQPVTRIADVRQQIVPRHAGDTIRIDVARGDSAPEAHSFEATLVATLPPWRQAMLGIVAAPTAADTADTKAAGVTVEWVLPEGPAGRAGVQVGDVVEAFMPDDAAAVTDDEARLSGATDLAGRLAGLEPGTHVTLSLRRGDDRPRLKIETTAFDPRLPADLPPLATDTTGDAAQVVRLTAAEVAEPAIAVVPAGDADATLGVLVYCGAPRGPVAEAEATTWKTAVARHGVAVIIAGSADPQRWSRDDADGIKRALAALHTRRPIDPRRVAVAGSGAGGSFAWLVAERLPAVVRGVAMQGAALPRTAAIPTAEPGRSLWVLLGEAEGDVGRRLADDGRRLEQAGHAVGTLPAAANNALPTDDLCRWVRLLGML